MSHNKYLGFLTVLRQMGSKRGAPQSVFTSSKLQVLWRRIVKEQEVHAIQIVQLLLVKGADVVEELGGHVSRSPGALGRGREVDLALHSGQLQHVAGVLLQRLVLPHHIVVDQAGVAQ